MLKSFHTRAFMALFLASFALLLVGCAPSVVGKWKGKMQIPLPQGSPVGNNLSLDATIEYTKEGAMTQTFSTPLGAVSVNGTYKTEDGKLIQNVDTVNVMGRSINIPADKKTSTIDYKIVGDKLQLSSNGETQELERVKESSAE